MPSARIVYLSSRHLASQLVQIPALFKVRRHRILQNLAIGYIAARSPQAKGRIERLWNTLQDRLVSELRLRGIRTVEAAQAYLAEVITDFNQRFGKPPADRQAAWARPPRDPAPRPGSGDTHVVS